MTQSAERPVKLTPVGFAPPENKLEAVARISNLTRSGPEVLGPGSKERKSVLTNLARGLGFKLDEGLSKPEFGGEVAAHLGVHWDESCYSSGSTITLEGLSRILEAAEAWLVDHGQQVELPERSIATSTDESNAILSVLAPLVAGTWDGKACVTEMKDAEDRQWAQDRWPGWYFEFIAQAALIRSLGGGPRKVANTSFDYCLVSTWDLKAHSENTRGEAILNDQDAMREALAEDRGLGFIVLSGERFDDDGGFREWHKQERLKAGKIPRSRRRSENDDTIETGSRQATSTYAFRPTRIEIFHIPDAVAFDQLVASGVIKPYNQGVQVSGASRKPKYKLMLAPAREAILLGSVELTDESALVGGRASRADRAAEPRVHHSHPELPTPRADAAGWQYGPEWLSALWGLPIAPYLDTRTGRTSA